MDMTVMKGDTRCVYRVIWKGNRKVNKKERKIKWNKSLVDDLIRIIVDSEIFRTFFLLEHLKNVEKRTVRRKSN